MKAIIPKPKKKILTQVSYAVSILFMGQYIIKELGRIWGFPEVGEQIAATFVTFGAPLEAVFLGKMWADKDGEVKNESSN